VLEKLEIMRAALIKRSTLLCNVTVDAANWDIFKPQLDSFLSALPFRDTTLSDFSFQPVRMREGLTIPAQVNYVGKGANLYDLGYKYDGSAEVIVRYLRIAYLHEKIRVQGGAYGAFSVFDDASGAFTYLSYRDPNVAATIENFDKAPAYLKGLDSSGLSESELTKAIIGVIGDIDSYQLPDAKGYTSMLRYLTNRTDALRQKTREEVLSTNGEDFIAFGEVLEKAISSESIAVLGSQNTLESANIGLNTKKVL
jgi:Zn-dependent M16 (insulinase) family peptidase